MKNSNFWSLQSFEIVEKKNHFASFCAHPFLPQAKDVYSNFGVQRRGTRIYLYLSYEKEK